MARLTDVIESRKRGAFRRDVRDAIGRESFSLGPDLLGPVRATQLGPDTPQSRRLRPLAPLDDGSPRERVIRETVQTSKIPDFLVNPTSGAQEAPPSSLRQTIARNLGAALEGFAAGAQATPQGAGADQGLGGVVGGLAGVADVIRRRQERELKAQEPFRELALTRAKTRAQEEERQPFELAMEKERQKGRESLQANREKVQQERIRLASRAMSQKFQISDAAAASALNEAKESLKNEGIIDPFDRTPMDIWLPLAQERADKITEARMGIRRGTPLRRPQPAAPPAQPEGDELDRALGFLE